MTSVTRRRRLGLLSTVLVAGLALAGCSASGAADLAAGAPIAVETPSATAAPAPAPAATDASCTYPAVASYAPDGPTPSADALPAGSTMAQIRERGSLVVGVSADTLSMGARNPLTGRIEGFDIDVLREISTAILGTPDALQFRVITSAQRIEALQTPVADGGVDIVARTMTMTCARWDSIAFSSEYFDAGQKVLVPRDSDAADITQLAGLRVCAPESTTTLDRLAEYPDVEAVGAATHTACLALFQQGQVDAITGDDTILAGFAAQDPYAKVVGGPISSEPYGLGMRLDQVDLVRFVNGVLERMRTDGTWTRLYDTWLSPLGPAPTPPAAVYGR